jgi:DNA-binding beta-propeller fold protein YncE
MRRFTPPLLVVLALAAVLSSCRKVENPLAYKGFPDDVGAVLVKNCATSGCHDDASFVAEGRLSLSGWEAMFGGSRAGAAVVPFRTDQSFLLNFINIDTSLGIVQTPTMPLNQVPLTAAEYSLIREWIANGAPSADGTIKWSDNPGRAKIYALNQGCDQMAILDRDTRLVMRYVDVGQYPGTVESPHNVKFSPDGRYWYVVFLLANPYIEKYDAQTDAFVGKAEVGQGSWNTIDITPDGRYAVSPDLNSGRVVVIDLAAMTLAADFNIGGSPHGVRIKPSFDAVYFTQQEGDELTKLLFTDLINPTGLENIDLEQNIPRTQPLRAMGPHEQVYTPDGSRYFVTCQYQDEVRIYQADNDSLLAVVRTGSFPSEIAMSSARPYALITCMEDTTMFPGERIKRGSVAVINYNTMQLVTSIYSGFQPHGIAVDDEKGLAYVTHRNIRSDGPAPHHSTACGGRNGNITAIRLGTLDLLPGFKHELSTDPYSVGLRR